MVEYIPNRGDMISLDFFPQVGNEIQKRRPALVITPQYQNIKTGLVTVFPMTSTIRGIDLEVVVDLKPVLEGAILPFQIKSLDYKIRKAKYITSLSDRLIDECIQKFLALIEMD